MPVAGRVDEEIKKELNQILKDELNDPRIEGIISVTRVQTAKDLSHAKAYVSIFGAKDSKITLKAINNASSHIRKLLFQRLRIRSVPNIVFYIDEGMEHSIKINKLLSTLNITPADDTDSDGSDS